MPNHYNGNRSPGQRAQQQLRDLGHAVRQTARDLDRSYPNTTRGNQIIHRYQRQTNKIVQGGRQHRPRSLPPAYNSDVDLSGLFIALYLLGMAALVVLGLILMF